MIAAVRNWADRMRGFGDHALSIPSLDGAFRPNDAIEEAAVVLGHHAPDNLVVADGATCFSSAGAVLRIGENGAETVEAGDAAVTAMAGAPDGRIAVARAGGASIGIISPDGTRQQVAGPGVRGDVTSLAFVNDGTIAATVGAEGRTAQDWRRDLMERGRTGSVWRLAKDNAERIADGLAWPSGVAPEPGGGLVVSVAWDASVVRLGRGGRPETVLANLPGYPARIVPATAGGYWLSIFAPRNQLVEFVLREKLFRRRMMAEIEPDYWVCPSLAPADSPLEVMQDGAQKVGGSIKPWAPSLSYGLIVKVGADFLPERSFHSRADGRLHGITSLAETADKLFATSIGGNAVIAIPVEG